MVGYTRETADPPLLAGGSPERSRPVVPRPFRRCLRRRTRRLRRCDRRMTRPWRCPARMGGRPWRWPTRRRRSLHEHRRRPAPGIRPKGAHGRTAEINLLIRSAEMADGAGDLIRVTPEAAQWEYTGLHVLRLDAGETWHDSTEQDEVAIVMLGGRCRVTSEARPGRSASAPPSSTASPGRSTCPSASDFTVEALTAAEVAACSRPGRSSSRAGPDPAGGRRGRDPRGRQRGSADQPHHSSPSFPPTACSSSKSSPRAATGRPTRLTSTTSAICRRSRSGGDLLLPDRSGRRLRLPAPLHRRRPDRSSMGDPRRRPAPRPGGLSQRSPSPTATPATTSTSWPATSGSGPCSRQTIRHSPGSASTWTEEQNDGARTWRDIDARINRGAGHRNG